MKRLLIGIICLCSTVIVSGQIYEREKPFFISLQHRVNFYGIYEVGKDGLYQYKEYENEKIISPYEYNQLSHGNERFYGYDKKNNRYYFYSDNVIGYYSPTKLAESKEFKKKISTNKVPIVTLEDIPQLKNIAKAELDKYYKKKNDTILYEQRIAYEKKREKRVKDSIEAMNRKEKEYNEYRKDHNWHDLTLDYVVSINCGFCKIAHNERNMYVVSLSSDTIYYIQDRPDIVMLGKTHSGLHYGEITKLLKQDKKFKEYVEIWRDSIALHNELSNKDAANINLYTYLQFKKEIKKEAPYGFIEKWGWDLNSAYGVVPYFTFYNTSEKTIKYVDLYFNLYNDVGDRCFLKYNKSYTGSIRGVGPVVTDSSGSWSWEKATHYTSADASEMKIVKIVITYMDKTVKTLTGNSIKYD